MPKKQEIAAAARKLIRLLQLCDDEDFVDEVVDCVQDCDELELRIRTDAQ